MRLGRLIYCSKKIFKSNYRISEARLFKNAGLLVPVLLAVAALSCINSFKATAADPEELKILKRKAARRYPPVKIPANASIPKGVELGFVGVVDGHLQMGDWAVVGKVKEIHPEKIVFQTDKTATVPSKIGQLAYRLPDGLKLALKPGQPIMIVHDHEFVNKHFASDLHISSGRTLILATSHGHRDKLPPNSGSAHVLFKGPQQQERPVDVVFYWSQAEHRSEITQTEDTKQRGAPLTLNADGRSKTQVIRSGDSAEITISGSKYVFKLLNSVHFEYGASHEQESGHTLEYVLVKKYD